MNRLHPTTKIEDVAREELFHAADSSDELIQAGEDALRRGEIAVVTCAAGVGSRWPQGAGVAKGLHPLAKFGGEHRSFSEVHPAKSRRTAQQFGADVPHFFTASHLTPAAIERKLHSLTEVAQFEKLWGDMTALPECSNVFAAVPRARGQQLKDQAQLDGWVRDGSAAHIESLCAW